MIILSSVWTVSVLIFFGEIGRETYAELGFDLSKQEWTCCGIVLSGNLPKPRKESDCYPDSFRRMHFNLIFENHTKKTLLDVEQLSNKATEAFETKRYLGIGVTCEKSRFLHGLKTVGKGFIGIVKHKDFIEASVSIIIFLLTVFNNLWQEGPLKLSPVEIFVNFLALLVILVTIFRFVRAVFRLCCKRIKCRQIHIYSGMSYADVNRRVASVLYKPFKPWKKRETYPFHPAAYACLKLYVDKSVREAFFLADRR